MRDTVRTGELVLIAILLIACSAAVYTAHYLLFHDLHHILIYLVGDIAYLPLEVFLVTLVIDRLISRREERDRRNKMNMVIGAFFSAVGQRLLLMLSDQSADAHRVAAHLRIHPQWSESDFRDAAEWVAETEFKVAADPAGLAGIRDYLREQRDFLLRLLENPTLLEHETFTDLLWSVFHLEEELVARDSLHKLPESDIDHLSGDVERAYTHLLRQWLAYMMHLRQAYPYLYSLAVRTNPFAPEAQVEVV